MASQHHVLDNIRPAEADRMAKRVGPQALHLDDTTLDNIDAMARGELRSIPCAFAHPLDSLLLTAEVRRLRQWAAKMTKEGLQLDEENRRLKDRLAYVTREWSALGGATNPTPSAPTPGSTIDDRAFDDCPIDPGDVLSLTLWRHKKGGLYLVLDMEVSATNGDEETLYVSYWSFRHRGRRCRKVEEFCDGRFQPVSEVDL